MVISSGIDQLIGNTPIINMEYLSNNKHNFIGKLEFFNPSGSVKDRTAIGLIYKAVESGRLKKGMTLVESSSGNLGHSLAMLCAHMGYKLLCIMDPKTPKANIDLVRAFGGEVCIVTETDEHGGYQKPRIEKARELAEENEHILNLDQYENPSSNEYHAATTGKEIFRQLDGNIDILVGAVSTGGSLCGTASYLKSQKPDIEIVAVEPLGSTIFGGKYKPFLQNGTGLSFTPGNFDNGLIDHKIRVSDQDAFMQVNRCAKDFGLLLGSSSGALIHAAIEVGNSFDTPKNIVMLLADGGIKYLSTIYNPTWLTENNIAI
ncbi:PLP-dependent cysteine synthase family protein [Sinobacterium caligoides]|nr:cysteine synthase family protein [Sinobacterium caligoides]